MYVRDEPGHESVTQNTDDERHLTTTDKVISTCLPCYAKMCTEKISSITGKKTKEWPTKSDNY